MVEMRIRIFAITAALLLLTGVNDFCPAELRLTLRAAATVEIGAGSAAAYAESQDGVKWVKPHLELVHYQGTIQNNVLLHSDPLGKRPLVGNIRLIQDPRERPAERRFLACDTPPYHADGSRFGGWKGWRTVPMVSPGTRCQAAFVAVAAAGIRASCGMKPWRSTSCFTDS